MGRWSSPGRLADAHLQAEELGTHLNRVVDSHEDLLDSARMRGLGLDGHLVGLYFGDRLLGGDVVARVLHE